ncbi:MAG: lysophospholipid acyltransferase family protein [Bacteroidota bacterium]
MIRAQKDRLSGFLLEWYTGRLIRRGFGRFLAGGAERGGGLNRSAPMVFYANHGSWWDGFAAYQLCRRLLRVDMYLMMEERQLSRYRFFRRGGVFSVDGSTRTGALESFSYACGLFDRPNRALWMFPQGVMLPHDTRPLRFRSGIARLAGALEGAQFIPVALRYEFLGGQWPEILALVGEPWSPGRARGTRELEGELERRLADLLDELGETIHGGEYPGFLTLLRGRESVNTHLDRLRGLQP